MIAELKVKHKEYYPNGQWLWVCHQRDKKKVDDDMVYFYLTDDFDLKALKVGDIIELDEKMEILEIGYVGGLRTWVREA